MQYNFKIVRVSKSKYFDVNIKEEAFWILNNFTDSAWSAQKAQEIIDGINDSTNKPKGEEYVWANEDVSLYSNQNGVFLFDTMAVRAKETDQAKLWLRLTHSEFITFMTDFKKFIEDNS